MNGNYLHCYTLGRFVPGQEQLHYLLPYDRQKALELFALHINEKQILLPRQLPLPASIAHTRLFVSRLSNYAMATFLWRSGYLSHSTNPFIRLLERISYERQLFRHLHLKESALDEVVLELFHSSQGCTPCIDLPDHEAYPPDLLLARLHFSAISPRQTMLRIFIGWTQAAPLGELNDLYNLLQRYMELLHQVLDTVAPPPLSAENGRHGETSHEAKRPLLEPIADSTVDWTTDAQALNAEKATVEAEDGRASIPSAEGASPKLTSQQPTPNWEIQESDGKDLLHGANGFLDMESEEDKNGEICQAETAVTPEDTYGKTDPPLQQRGPLPSEDEMQLYRGLKPPRMYLKTLRNICIMVTERQRQIDAKGEIPRLDTFNDLVRPSRNTMLKIPELFTHWFDKQYRWNIITWLRHYSGHTETEVSEILSTLYYSLSPEAWAAVTPAGKEAETNRSRRHHAREEGKPRPGEQFGAMN